MDAVLEKMIESALEAQSHAYAPYSKHPVGAAIEAEDGEIYSGCNVENAAFPLGNCAEPVAIAKMLLGGARRIKRVVVASPTRAICSPCGGCRQRIKEFANRDTEIVMVDFEGNVQITQTLGDLLPLAFDNSNVLDVIDD